MPTVMDSVTGHRITERTIDDSLQRTLPFRFELGASPVASDVPARLDDVVWVCVTDMWLY